MPDWLVPWLTPGLLIALFAWLRADVRELRADLRELRTDLRDMRNRLSRVEGRIDGWQDQRHPARPAAG